MGLKDFLSLFKEIQIKKRQTIDITGIAQIP